MVENMTQIFKLSYFLLKKSPLYFKKNLKFKMTIIVKDFDNCCKKSIRYKFLLCNIPILLTVSVNIKIVTKSVRRYSTHKIEIF